MFPLNFILAKISILLFLTCNFKISSRLCLSIVLGMFIVLVSNRHHILLSTLSIRLHFFIFIIISCHLLRTPLDLVKNRESYVGIKNNLGGSSWYICSIMRLTSNNTIWSLTLLFIIELNIYHIIISLIRLRNDPWLCLFHIHRWEVIHCIVLTHLHLAKLRWLAWEGLGLWSTDVYFFIIPKI